MGRARGRVLGFPAACDGDVLGYAATAGLLAGLVNHLGDPEVPGRWPVHVLDLEREVIAFAVDLFGGTTDTCWGYVTAGGSSEGVLHGMWLGRERFPDAIVYTSTAAHYCVTKAAHLLGLPLIRVGTDAGGAMRPDRLAAAATEQPDRAVLLVATLGTTMTEAVDDLPALHTVLDGAVDAGVTRRHVVVDAALSGPGLAVDDGWAAELLAAPDPRGRVLADSVCFSGHKLLGTPLVCGVALSRRAHAARVAHAVDYIGSRDVTVSGSRSGLAAVVLWWALAQLGHDGLRERVRGARGVAARAVEALTAMGWAAWRHPHACTVVLDPAPPEPIARRWALPVADGISHLVCVPGVSDARTAAFLTDLAAATGRPAPDLAVDGLRGGVPLPRQGRS